jgi:SET domain-containing protein
MHIACVSVRKHPKKGWALYAEQDIPQISTFIGEYVGDLVRTRDMNRASTYIVSLREECTRSAIVFRTNIDAGHTGNFTRFINHSCAPNAAFEPYREDQHAFVAGTDAENDDDDDDDDDVSSTNASTRPSTEPSTRQAHMMAHMSPNAPYKLLPRLHVISIRPIHRGDEITVDYGMAHGVGLTTCACGTSACKGRLPFDPRL